MLLWGGAWIVSSSFPDIIIIAIWQRWQARAQNLQASLFLVAVNVMQPCRQACFTAWHYSNLFTSQLRPQPPITAATNLFCLLLFLLERRKTRHNTVSICLPTSPNTYFYFFIGKSSTFIWKWNKWQTFQPPGAPSCGQGSKVGQPDECPAKASWRGVKKTLLKRARRLSKNQPLASAHQEGAGAWPFPWRGRANGRPQCLRGEGGGVGGGGAGRRAPDPVVLPSGVKRPIPGILNSQPNCHSWHSTQPLQAHNLCSYGS